MRRTLTRAKKDSILREANFICLYCGDPANEVDHIHPHSYSLNDKEENLVASCSICNRIAGSKVFDGFIEKQTYIREEREKERYAKAINEYRSLCQAVGLPIYMAKQTKEEPEKVLKPKGMSKPPIPKTWDELSRPKTINWNRYKVEPEPEAAPKPKRKRRERKPKPKWTVPASYDFRRLKAWQILFRVKHEKQGTYEIVAAQYGLTPEMTEAIAEGKEPGNDARKRLNLSLI